MNRLLNVTVGDQNVEYTVVNRNWWDLESIDFVATDSSTTLRFYVPGYYYGGVDIGFLHSQLTFVDDISVVAVPEPSICGMLLTGALLLGWRRKSSVD